MLLLLAEVEMRLLPEPDEADSQEQFQQGLAILDRAATLGQRDHPTRAYHVRRAEALAQLDRKDEAAGEFGKARAIQPSTSVDFSLLGLPSFQEGAAAQALVYFDNTLHKEPNHFWASYLKAICHLRL